MPQEKFGLVLGGGGARAAFQAGVLRALVDIQLSEKLSTKIDILTGVSAGAVNAAFWAAYAQDLQVGTQKMCELWSTLRPRNIFRTDISFIIKNAVRLLWSLSLGSVHHRYPTNSLLDTTPLRRLLHETISYENIKKNIHEGLVDALAVMALDYSLSKTITFVQSEKPFQHWARHRRKSEETKIEAEHIMASCAIPGLFPPVQIGERYFGDGNLRNVAPLSAALHLGATKLIVVGVRRQAHFNGNEQPPPFQPSLGRILNSVLNAIILDSIDTDMERLEMMNKLIENVPEEQKKYLPFHKVDYLWLYPSEDLGRIAQESAKGLPRILRYFLTGLGSQKEESDVLSYLLFESRYCSKLIELGYQDALKRRNEIVNFLKAGR